MKNKSKAKLTMLAFAFVLMILVIPVHNVRAVVGSLTPSSASGLVDTPIDFKCTGLVATVGYDVRLDTAVRITNLIASSTGEIIFTLTVSTAGFYSVTVVNTTTTDIVASATLDVNDMVEDIMPWLILFVTISVLFGVIAKIKV